jgi:DNA-binding CsgD family transcriptional regulator
MLVGRGEEIVALNALFRECKQGKGIVAVIRGPVASGKTTLLLAFAEQAVAAGGVFLNAAASRAERSLPLSILHQLFRTSLLPSRAVSQIAELLESRALIDTLQEPQPETVSPAMACVFERLLRLLTELSESRPVVIAVDDLQYADVVSLQCLSYLARRASTACIFMILTECTQTLPVDRLLHAEILRQGTCHCIPLAPLTQSSVASLLSEHLDSEAAQHLAPACHAMTGGNPLLVNALGEDFRAPADGFSARLVPRSAFRSAVVTCLHRYEPLLVELAQAVAVLDESATSSRLGELLEISPESATRGIDALSASGLLESGHFRHEAARQSVLDHMTADERAEIHARTARILYRTGATPAILAGHLMAAHTLRAQWTVPVLQEAAEQALADGEADRAIGYLRRAERECVNDQQRAAVRFALACANWPIDPECAARYLPELATDARQGRLDSECMAALAYYLLWIGDTSNAAEVLAALDIAHEDTTSQEAGFQARHVAIRSPLDFLYPDLAKRARTAARDMESSGNVTVRRRPQEVSLLRSALRNDNEVTLIAAEKVLRERGLNDPALASITTALMTLICDDLLDRAAFWCSALLRESEAPRGSPLWHAVLTGLRAMIEIRQGNLSAAENHARTALSSLTRKAWGVAIGVPLSSLMLTAIASRKHKEALEYLRTPVPEAMFETPYGLLYLCARGEYYLATGRAQAALADFQACGNRMVMWGLDLPGLVPWRTKAAEAYLVMGDIRAARELSKEQLAQVGSRSSRTRGISLRALALTSHPGKRTPLLRESAEVLRDSGARLELAYTFTELSNAHLALGERDRAHWAARQARNLAERCGAHALKYTLEITDPDPREPVNGVETKPLAQLSDAERRVAVLAAYGYTNCQIARKLYITVSTVEQHLTRVYRKLGVTGRAELPIEI